MGTTINYIPPDKVPGRRKIALKAKAPKRYLSTGNLAMASSRNSAGTVVPFLQSARKPLSGQKGKDDG